jgi:hypothetical protein
MSYLQELQEAHKARIRRLTGKSPGIERKVVPLAVSVPEPIIEAQPTSASNPLAWAPISRDVQKTYLMSRDIIRIVCAAFNVLPYEVMSHDRRQPICRARQVCLYLIKKYTNASWAKVGLFLGGYETSSLRHSRCKIRGLLVSDPQLMAIVGQIEQEIKDLKDE